MADKEELAREVRTTARHFAAAITEAREAGLIVDIKVYRDPEEIERGQPRIRIDVNITEPSSNDRAT